MKILNRRISVLSAIILAVLTPVSLVWGAYEPSEVTIWTDRPSYSPGEKGTLFVALYNNRDVAIAIKNITLIFEDWLAYTGDAWIGNETRTMDVALPGGRTHVFNDLAFTVPADGRAETTNVYVEIWTDHGYESGVSTVYVPEVPTSIGQIVTLFTILVVLMIVCTIIIAATIFLSARRPPVTWRPEQKTE